MALADDIATDWEHVDGIETVTHTPVPTGDPTATVKAHRGELSYREIAAGGPIGLEPSDMPWTVWAATLAITPKGGDTITDSAGDVWTILLITATTIGNTVIKWRCVCRKRV